MTAPESVRRDDADEDLLAELFDAFLEDVLHGRRPDLAAALPDRPDLADAVRETWAMACSVAGRREPTHPVLGGYEIQRELGRGGMGTVYLARHVALDRQVAIKVLPHSLALSSRSKRRFLAEARALARLRHDHVVHIHRVIDEAEMLAFEMEYVAGPSLQRLIHDLRPMAPGAAPDRLAELLGLPVAALGVRSAVEYFVKLGSAMARALAAVHQNGIVHRDVKPSNILLRPDGRPVLADFGLARIGDLALTQSGAFAGTPIYAAPERLRDGDEAVDCRADVYSLGVTLYEAITLAPPFQGRSTDEVLRRIEAGRVPPLRRLAPHVSRDLQTVLQKAMEPDPRHRYASAAEFADDLDRLLALQPVRARPAGTVRRVTQVARRHRRVLAAAVAGAALVAAVLWPFLAQAQAAAGARTRAGERVREARLHLLSTQSQVWTGGAARGGGAEGLGGRAVSEQVQALERAREAYAAALPALAGDPQVALESAVVAAALWLRREAPTSRSGLEQAFAGAPFAAIAAPLPPFTRRLVRDLASGAPDAVALRRELATAEVADRYAAGLLGFLLGDLATCEASWADLDGSRPDQALVDAGLGMLYAADGFAERAYPRLFHATRSLPTATGLALELADVALAMGDVSLARSWLDRVPLESLDAATGRRCQRLLADVAVAEGRTEEAVTAYRHLLAEDRDDSVLQHRLATLAIDGGDLDGAEQILRRMAARWPGLARVRLDLARLALSRRDRALYLEQARWVLAQDVGRGRSRGTQRQCLEVLRLGALRELFNEAVVELGPPPPIRDWRGPELPADPWHDRREAGAVQAMLQVLARYDRSSVAARLQRPAPWVAEAEGIAAVMRDHPGVLAALPVPLRLLAWSAGPALARNVPPLLASWTLPWQRSLGAPLKPVRMQPLVSRLPPMPGLRQAATLGALRLADGSEVLLVGAVPLQGATSAGEVALHSTMDGRRIGVVASERDDVMFGYALADLGDTDRDGHPEFLVGAPVRRSDSGLPGEVVCISGRDLAVAWRVAGDGVGFGVALAVLGDVDGDGWTDFAVGSSPEMRSSAPLGSATVFSGRDRRPLYTCTSDRSGVWFGSALAVVPDVDGDGVADLLVGGNHGGAPGLVRLCSGRNGAVLHEWEDPGPDSEFGRRVAAAGDVDGDGVCDCLVSATGTRDPAGVPGTVFVYSGRDGHQLGALRGDAPGDAFGYTLGAVPDWAGDGRPVLVVGAPRGGITGGGYIRIVDQRTLRPVRSFFAAAGNGLMAFGLTTLRPLADGAGWRVVASSQGADGGARIWSLASPQEGPR